VAKWVDTPPIAGPEVPVPVTIDVRAEAGGYQDRFTGVRDEWQQRLVSLRGAVNAMSASDEGS
jgi:hypothetical protein